MLETPASAAFLATSPSIEEMGSACHADQSSLECIFLQRNVPLPWRFSTSCTISVLRTQSHLCAAINFPACMYVCLLSWPRRVVSSKLVETNTGIGSSRQKF